MLNGSKGVTMSVGTTTPAAGTRRRAATRERLLDAAREILARDGIQGASVEHICENAGFTRGAFYSNFASKDDLILAMFNREKTVMFESLKVAADPAMLHGDNVEASVEAILERFFTLQSTDREWFLVHSEFVIHGLRHEKVGQEFTEAWRETKDEFLGVIASVVESLGRRFTIDPEHAAMVIMGTFELALREALMEGREADSGLLRKTLPTLLLSVTEPAP